MKKLSKLLILLLSVALVCAALAVVISADTPSVEYTDAEGQTQTTDSIGDALANVKEGGTVTLKSDFEISSPIVIAKPMTFDMAGRKLTNTATTAVFSVTAEGVVKINGGGYIETAGTVVELSDPDTETEAKPDVTFDGRAGGASYGVKILSTAGKLFDVQAGSLYVDTVEVKTSVSSESAVALGAGTYFGMKNGVVTVDDKATDPEGKYFLNITSSAIVDILDSTVVTTANGIGAADGTSFAVTIKGATFLCEGNTVAGQTFFTAKGITEGFDQAGVILAKSSFISDGYSVVRATAKLFDTDLTPETGRNFSVEATDSLLQLTGDEETALYAFGGAAYINIGSGSRLVLDNGAGCDAAASAAKSVTLLPGVRLKAASTDLELAEGQSIVFDPMTSLDYPFTVGTVATATQNLHTFDVLTVEGYKEFNKAYANEAVVGGLFQANHFTGSYTFEGSQGDGKLVYRLPKYVSDGNGGYVPASGAEGTVDVERNNATYTPPAAEGQPGTITLAGYNGSLTQTYFDFFFMKLKHKAEDGGVSRYSFDFEVDATAGAPRFEISLMGQSSSNGAQTGDMVAYIEGFTFGAGSASRTVEGGVMHHVDIVLDVANGKAMTFLNGEAIAEVTRGVSYTMRETARFYLKSQSYREDVSIAFDNIEGVRFDTFRNGATSVVYSDYIANGTDYPATQVGGDITVNGLAYANLLDAYEAAGKLSSVVQLNAELSGNFTVGAFDGAVVTNGFGADLNVSAPVSGTVISDFNGNDVYHFSNEIYGEPINVKWYGGIAADPEADTEAWVSTVAGGGSAPSAPSQFVVGSQFEYGSSLLSFAGWSDEYVSLSDYDDINDYIVAAEAAMLEELPVVTKGEGELGEGRTYYPIYAVDIPHILFKVERRDGTVNYFTTITEWNTLATTYLTADREALEKGLRDGDVLTLMSDLTFNSGSAMQIGMMSMTIDLNGYTMNTSARSGMPVFTIGSAGAGNGNGNHNNAVGLTLISSRPGGAIIDEKSLVLSSSNGAVLMTVFSVCGSNKTLHVGGENSEDIYFKCATLIQSIGAASGTGTGCSVWFDGITVDQIPVADKNSVSYPYALIDYRNQASGSVNNMGLTFTDAKITSTTQNWFVRTWAGSKSALRQNITFNDSTIELQHRYAYLAQLDSAEQNLVLNNTSVTMAVSSFGTISAGKIILGENTVIKNFGATITDYNASNISNGTGTYKGIHYGAAGLTTALYDVKGESTYLKVVKPSDVFQAEWLDFDGESIGTATLAKGADASKFAPAVSPEKVLTTMTVKCGGWQLAEGAEATAPVFVPVAGEIVRNVPSIVSVNLNTQLSVNVYVPVALFQYIDTENSTAFDMTTVITDGGVDYYKATVAVDTNEVFTGAEITIALSEGGFTSSKTSYMSVVEYARLILADDTMSDEDHDLAYYMLTYIRAAYDYMTEDDNENAVAEIDAILDGYTPVGQLGERTEYTTDASALTGKLEIGVNLASTPEYVIHVLDDSITTLTINGTSYDVVDGYVTYSKERIFSFDKSFTVALESGESGTYCYADYVETLGSGDAALAALTEALYDYIVFSKSYGN